MFAKLNYYYNSQVTLLLIVRILYTIGQQYGVLMEKIYYKNMKHFNKMEKHFIETYQRYFFYFCLSNLLKNPFFFSMQHGHRIAKLNLQKYQYVYIRVILNLKHMLNFYVMNLLLMTQKFLLIK